MTVIIMRILMAAWLIFCVCVSVSRHGKPQDPVDARDTVIGALLIAIILYFGGFWS
jgi:hypothetical protein